MNKEKSLSAARRAPRKYQYSDEGPHWLAIRLNGMTERLRCARGYTLSSDALRKNGRPVVKAVREYLETESPELTPRARGRLQRSLARYEGEAE